MIDEASASVTPKDSLASAVSPIRATTIRRINLENISGSPRGELFRTP